MRRLHEVSNANQPLWRVKDASNYLGVPSKGIYALIEARQLPCVRIGSRIRFIPAEIFAWVASNRSICGLTALPTSEG